MRSRFQGVTNIVRFNWHFYAIAAALILLGLAAAPLLSQIPKTLLYLALAGATVTTLVSLAASFYIYDCSKLYRLEWLEELSLPRKPVIANINAGFDETSTIIAAKQPSAELIIWDFYDAEKHTEVSIKRARTAFPPHNDTQTITTDSLPKENSKIDLVILFMAAHEIRDPLERNVFFSEIHRTLSASGKVVVTEHLRDLPNFLAYTVGFLHFHSRATWIKTFTESGFRVKQERKKTAFVSTFVLEKT